MCPGINSFKVLKTHLIFNPGGNTEEALNLASYWSFCKKLNSTLFQIEDHAIPVGLLPLAINVEHSPSTLAR